MIKLLPILLLCFLFSSCKKVGDDIPDSDYRFEVSCGNCTIRVASGSSNVVTYNVQGYQSIPYNHSLPIITISLWTNYDQDDTLVKLVGSGYNRILFNDYLYYDNPTTVFQFTF